MTAHIRIFINEHPVSVPGGSSLGEAVARFDSALAAALGEGTAYLTDGAGRRMRAEDSVTAGSIVRAIRSARIASDDRGVD